MSKCPICESVSERQRGAYLICPNCACWFQSPLPPKIYHDPSAPMVMSERDKEVNRHLAVWLFEHVMDSKPGLTLDVGCGPYPYLAHCLGTLGCIAEAMDCAEGLEAACKELKVTPVAGDFELLQHFGGGEGYRLVTMIHSFEHCYDPVDAMLRLRKIIADDGRVFLRLPDHTVRGFEAHLKPDIHPYMHCLDSILECLRITQTFVIAEGSVMDGAGQRDILLKPI